MRGEDASGNHWTVDDGMVPGTAGDDACAVVWTRDNRIMPDPSAAASNTACNGANAGKRTVEYRNAGNVKKFTPNVSQRGHAKGKVPKALNDGTR